MFLFTFFSLSLIFTRVAAGIPAAKKFHVVPSDKICLLLFYSLALAAFLVELR